MRLIPGATRRLPPLLPDARDERPLFAAPVFAFVSLLLRAIAPSWVRAPMRNRLRSAGRRNAAKCNIARASALVKFRRRQMITQRRALAPNARHAGQNA
jgi:hypothetical protein